MQDLLEKSWKEVLSEEYEKTYFIELTQKVYDFYHKDIPMYPPSHSIFTAFSLCPFNKIKIVILGQDPYHGVGQAHGLCFSVQDGTKIPPSLQNIYKELLDNLGIPIHPSGNLERWANQGVLLLNATLTVEAGKPSSHHGIGWEQFTDAVIQKISDEKEHIVFLLWGKHAQDKGSRIDITKHLVLKAPHPSPFSAHLGFFGCKHFSQTNEYLTRHKQRPIEW